MLRTIEGLPSNVIGVEAVGKVEADDYRNVLDPAVEAVEAEHGKVRLLLVLGDEYDGYSAGAAWQDTKLGFGERKAWERIALVTDHERVLDVVGLFAWMIAGEVQTFRMSELDEAKAWLGEAAG